MPITKLCQVKSVRESTGSKLMTEIRTHPHNGVGLEETCASQGRLALFPGRSWGVQ